MINRLKDQMGKLKILFFALLLSVTSIQVANAAASWGPDIFIDSTCPTGPTYVKGYLSLADDGLFPEMVSGRSYFNWYTNGVFTGSKQAEDSTQPIYAPSSTDSCVHLASNDYDMGWSVRFEDELGDEYNPSSNYSWEGSQ